MVVAYSYGTRHRWRASRCRRLVFGLHSYGLYSHGLDSCGLYAYVVKAYVSTVGEPAAAVGLALAGPKYLPCE